MHTFKLRLPTLITAVVALALLTVAIDWSTPTGVALADHGIHTPGKPTAASSAGVMMVSWGSTTGATSGYQYRYSTNSLCLLVGSDCDFEGPGKDWTDHGSGANSNAVTFPGEGDTPRLWSMATRTSSKFAAKRAAKRVLPQMFPTVRTIGRRLRRQNSPA